MLSTPDSSHPLFFCPVTLQSFLTWLIDYSSTNIFTFRSFQTSRYQFSCSRAVSNSRAYMSSSIKNPLRAFISFAWWHQMALRILWFSKAPSGDRCQTILLVGTANFYDFLVASCHLATRKGKVASTPDEVKANHEPHISQQANDIDSFPLLMLS